MDQGLPGVSIHGILRQEYWSGLPFPSPGDIPDPGIEPGSPALKADSLPSEPPRKLSGKCWFLSTINRLSHAPFHLNIPPTVSPSSKFPLAIYLKVNLIKFVFKLGPNHIQQRRQWHPTSVLLPGKSQGRGAWWAAVHGVAKSRTRLRDFTFTFHFHALEKDKATHSTVLAWRIPGTGEPGGLPSTGLHRVGHDWSDLAAAATIYKTFLMVHFPQTF